MAYDIEFSGAPDQEGKTDRFFLCSTGQWQMFADWVSALTGEYPCLKMFAETGECKNTFQIKTELTQAMNDSHPSSNAVSSLADDLLDKIGEGDADEMVAITDGSDDDGEDREKPELSSKQETFISDEETMNYDDATEDEGRKRGEMFARAWQERQIALRNGQANREPQVINYADSSSPVEIMVEGDNDKPINLKVYVTIKPPEPTVVNVSPTPITVTPAPVTVQAAPVVEKRITIDDNEGRTMFTGHVKPSRE